MMSRNIQVTVDDRIFNWLKEVAKENERSVSAQVRHFIKLGLAEELAGIDPDQEGGGTE